MPCLNTLTIKKIYNNDNFAPHSKNDLTNKTNKNQYNLKLTEAIVFAGVLRTGGGADGHADLGVVE